jgi:hypothetical protein
MRYSPRPHTISELSEPAIRQVKTYFLDVSVAPSELLALVQPAEFDSIEQRK